MCFKALISNVKHASYFNSKEEATLCFKDLTSKVLTVQTGNEATVFQISNE